MQKKFLIELSDKLNDSKSVLILSHIRPDGDAVGSLLGFGLTLQSIGKNVQMVIEDSLPTNLHHLQGFELIKAKPEGKFDLICVLDCSDLLRAGKFLSKLGQPDFNIDHHKTNEFFAKNNLVDTSAVATSELIVEIIEYLNIQISAPIAAALLTGIITDTIGFRTSNMTPKVLRIAADLMEKEIDMVTLYYQALVRKSFEAIRLWGAGLAKTQSKDRVVWTTLTLEDRLTSGYSGRDDADLINILSAIEGTDIAILFSEEPEESVKVSWRAIPGIDVSEVALSFGGGGHPAASGAEIEGELQEIQSKVLERTRLLLY